MSLDLSALGVPEGRWSDRVRQLLILGILGSLTLFAGIVAPTLVESLGDVPSEELRANARGVILGLVNSSLTGWGMWVLGLAMVLTVLFMVVDRPMERVRIDFRKLTNGLVYLYTLTYFVYLLRPGLVAIVLLGAVLVAPVLRARTWSPERFYWVVAAFAAVFLLGFLRVWIGVDSVRPHVPLDVQLNGALPVFHGLLVFYVVKRNGWGIKEFEGFFKWLLFLGVLVSFESVLVFYLHLGSGLEFLGMTSVAPSGLFQSAFIGNFHVAGRIGITVLFGSLYFYSRKKNALYLLAAVLGFLLLFSTLLQQVIISTLVGLVITFVLVRRGLARGSRSANQVNGVLLPLLALVSLSSLLLFSNLAISTRGDSLTGIAGHLDRPIMLIRGLDTFLYTAGLGTGPGLVPYYTGSAYVPTLASDRILPVLGADRDELLEITARGGQFNYDGISAFTLHNLWFTFTYEWGVLGALLVLYIGYRGWKLFREASEAEKPGPLARDMTSFWVLFGLAFSVSMSVLFSSKFSPMEYFVVLFLFLEASAREAGLRRETQKEEATATRP